LDAAEVGREGEVHALDHHQLEAERQQQRDEDRPVHHEVDQETLRDVPQGEQHRGRDEHAEERVQPELLVHPPADVGAEDDERAVGQVDDVHHPPDQGEPHGDERQKPSLQKAVNRRLEKGAHCFVPGQIILASADSFGHTVTALPFWIWMTDMGLKMFCPGASNFSLPKNDSVSRPERASRTLSASEEPAFSAARAKDRQAAVASALWYSGAWPNLAWMSLAES